MPVGDSVAVADGPKAGQPGQGCIQKIFTGCKFICDNILTMDMSDLLIAVVVLAAIVWLAQQGYLGTWAQSQSFCVASGIPSSAIATASNAASSVASTLPAAAAGAAAVGASLPASISQDETVSQDGTDASAVAGSISTPATIATAAAPSTVAAIVPITGGTAGAPVIASVTAVPTSNSSTAAPTDSSVTASPASAVAASGSSGAASAAPTTSGQTESLAPRPVVVQTKAGAAPAVIVPIGTSVRNGTVTYNYVGCFEDSASHVFKKTAPMYMTIGQCRAAAAAAGAPNYSIQHDGVAPPGMYICRYGNGDYRTYGSSSYCGIDANGNQYSSPGANAVYRT